MSAQLDDEATEDELAGIGDHLATCSACRAHERQLGLLDRQVRLHAVEPVPDLTDQILGIVGLTPRGRGRLGVAVVGLVAAILVAMAIVVTSRDDVRLSPTPKVEVSDVAVMQAPTGGISVVSFRLRNLSAEEDALVAVHTDAAGAATLHTLRDVDGRSEMRSVDEIVIDAGSTRQLGDGTSHIMLLDVRQGLHTGGRVHIELEFARAAPVDVDGVVTA